MRYLESESTRITRQCFIAPEGSLRCSLCDHIGKDVLRYEAKIGGRDQPVTVTACADIDACLERQKENRI